jgi:hypothetical protein
MAATGLAAITDAIDNTSAQGEQMPAQEALPLAKPRRVVTVRRKEDAATGPAELSWEEFGALGCRRYCHGGNTFRSLGSCSSTRTSSHEAKVGREHASRDTYS